MAVAPVYVEATPVTPLPFGLLDSVPVVSDPNPHIGLGIQLESEFCGPARAYFKPCDDIAAGTISVSVDDAALATITGTGEPAGTGYTIDWGDGNSDVGVALDGQTNTYAAPGDYVVVVTGADGYFATVTITVEDAAASGPFVSDGVFQKISDGGITTVVGEPIPIYSMFECRAPGSWDRGEARARRSLDLGASRAVESAFQTLIATGATDVTPSGTAVNIVDGLALLEEYAGANYGGIPVIHMTRGDATRLIHKQVVIRVGDHLETVLGSLVIAGAGYVRTGGPSAPAAGAGWMIATGQVTVREGNTIVSPAVLENPYTNEFKALAERLYVPTYECFHAAVEVTQAACCP